METYQVNEMKNEIFIRMRFMINYWMNDVYENGFGIKTNG
jgi:hypothetical protein